MAHKTDKISTPRPTLRTPDVPAMALVGVLAFLAVFMMLGCHVPGVSHAVYWPRIENCASCKHGYTAYKPKLYQPLEKSRRPMLFFAVSLVERFEHELIWQ